MKKALLKKIVMAAVVASTITSLTPLGVSAATTNSIANNYYNLISNKMSKTGWVRDNGKWYYLDNKGVVQTGVIKVNGKAYCLNKSGVMETGNVIVNNNIYKCSLDGQVIGINLPTIDKIFDSNNNVVKDNTKNPTVSNSNTNQGATNSGNVTSNSNSGQGTTNVGNTTNNSNSNQGTTSTGNTGSNSNSNQGLPTTGNTTTNSTNTNTTTSNPSTGNTNSTSNTGNTTNTNTGSTTNAGNTTTTNNSTSGTSVDVQGLPQLPKTYSINVQTSAEAKILELMNAKRTEAGLKPLALDNTLLQVARYKSDSMIQYNYFDHTNPDGTKYINWLQTVGYKYTTAGENIAYNTYDAVELFTQWWNSPGHRANMMNASYTKVGIGVLQGNGKYMGTQEFSN